MREHLRANLWLLLFSVVLCCLLYPLALWAIGQTAFRSQADGSLLGKDGKPVTRAEDAVGSRLIAQPFTGKEYFWPRPSAVSYNAAASGASNWAASNYLLRDRVARILGPIVKYRSGTKKGQLVGKDIESWFHKDLYQGKPGIVAQWAEAHPALAVNWVKADKLNADYVTDWQQAHEKEVAEWVKEHPETPNPEPTDLAVLFFKAYSESSPGTWPKIVEHRSADGQTEKHVEPVEEDDEIQSVFFDMWRQDHPKADLEDVPADMVMASGSGLDPHITLANALYQLDRVADERAQQTKQPVEKVRKEIENLLRSRAESPLNGLAGVPLVNVLEVNLALNNLYSASADKPTEK
jgi:K+-transporting ATPase ATPase C chain